MPIRTAHPFRRALVPALLGLLGLASCRRSPTAIPPESPTVRALHANLRLVPSDARIVLGLDLGRLRASPAWKELAAGPVRDASQLWSGCASALAIDPVEQVREVLVAVPGERQHDDRSLVVMRSDQLNSTRAAAWARAHQAEQDAAVFVPPDGLVLARGAWADRVLGLGRSQRPDGSLADDPELLRLCERAAVGHPLWMVAAVPADLRQRLIAQGSYTDVASLLRVRATVDVDRQLSVAVVAELSSRPDALALARRLQHYLDAAKRHPDVLAQGLAPYLEAVTLAPRGPNLHATLELPAAQAGELIASISDILRAAWRSRPAVKAE